jgi:hypothetical protein
MSSLQISREKTIFVHHIQAFIMKKTVTSLTLVLLITSCTATADRHISGEKTETPAPAENPVISSSAVESITGIIDAVLVPLEIADSTNSDVFQKYSMEFSGNCYSCDLANLQIEPHQLTLTNVCDTYSKLVLPIERIQQTLREIRLVTRDREFIFTQVATVPVYELQMTGKPLTNQDLRIGTYYTFRHKLPAFKIHDCGEFQG